MLGDDVCVIEPERLWLTVMDWLDVDDSLAERVCEADPVGLGEADCDGDAVTLGDCVPLGDRD